MLAENMLAAWDQRRRAAFATARAGLAAPGLVKAVVVAQASAEFDRANAMVGYWSTIGGAS